MYIYPWSDYQEYICNLNGFWLFDVSSSFLISWFFICSSLVFCALASRDELQSRKVKLDYDEVGTCQKDVINVWDKKLLNCRAKIRCDMEDIHSTLKEGMHVGWLLTMKSEDFFFGVCVRLPFDTEGNLPAVHFFQ